MPLSSPLRLVPARALIAPPPRGSWPVRRRRIRRSVNVLMVNNPQMVELQKLTAAHFTEETGIKVNFTVLPENDVRDKISQDFSNQAGQYDVATISNFEVPFYAKNNWLLPLDSYVSKDTGLRPRACLVDLRG